MKNLFSILILCFFVFVGCDSEKKYAYLSGDMNGNARITNAELKALKLSAEFSGGSSLSSNGGFTLPQVYLRRLRINLYETIKFQSTS